MGIWDWLESLFGEPEPKKPSAKASAQSSAQPTVKTQPSSTPARGEAKQEVKPAPKQKPIRIGDREIIEHHLTLKAQPKEIAIVFYCPMHMAKIYCHSILIDKLGDLTKFIVRSLYKGHSVEEICQLTAMGEITIKEEMAYLVRGGLVKEEDNRLTDLGSQYGKLLEKFNELSNGIEVTYNAFADSFEPDASICNEQPGEKELLPSHFVPTLARNDNYSNSLDVALRHIADETPFSKEIKQSLYTSVRVSKDIIGYKKVCIKSIDHGLISTTVPHVKIAIPYDRIAYKLKYTWIDPYRGAITLIKGLVEKYADLITEKAKLVINTVDEENDTDILQVEVNDITGEFSTAQKELTALPDDKSIFPIEKSRLDMVLRDETCAGIFLEEVDRQTLYQIRCFPYIRMEAM